MFGRTGIHVSCPFCGHRVYFPRFGMLYREKSGSPDWQVVAFQWQEAVTLSVEAAEVGKGDLCYDARLASPRRLSSRQSFFPSLSRDWIVAQITAVAFLANKTQDSKSKKKFKKIFFFDCRSSCRSRAWLLCCEENSGCESQEASPTTFRKNTLIPRFDGNQKHIRIIVRYTSKAIL
jgi:hypothetical protein